MACTRYLDLKNASFYDCIILPCHLHFDFNKNSYTISYETYYDPVKGYCGIHSRADNEPLKNYFSILKASINSTKFLLKKNYLSDCEIEYTAISHSCFFHIHVAVCIYLFYIF